MCCLFPTACLSVCLPFFIYPFFVYSFFFLLPFCPDKGPLRTVRGWPPCPGFLVFRKDQTLNSTCLLSVCLCVFSGVCLFLWCHCVFSVVSVCLCGIIMCFQWFLFVCVVSLHNTNTPTDDVNSSQTQSTTSGTFL